MADKVGLLARMVQESKPEPPASEKQTSPEKVDSNQEDLMVFMKDFENTDLSAVQRLEALKELVRLIK